MPADNNVTLFTLQTVTTSAVTGTVLATKTGTPNRGLNCRILYTGVSAATTGCVMQFKQQKSTDGSTTTSWIDSVYANPITYTTSPVGGVLDMKIYAEKAYPFIRIVATPSTSTGSPSGVYQAQIDAAIPG